MKTMFEPRALSIYAFTLLLGLPAQGVRADDCAFIREATFKGLEQERWHTVNSFSSGAMKLVVELIRADGKLYTRKNDEAWTPAPMSVDAVVRQNQDMFAKGQLKLSACKKTGSEKLPQGKADRYEYLTLPLDAAPVPARVWIGSDDGLPYRSESAQTASTTTYAGVTAPR